MSYSTNWSKSINLLHNQKYLLFMLQDMKMMRLGLIFYVCFLQICYFVFSSLIEFSAAFWLFCISYWVNYHDFTFICFIYSLINDHINIIQH